MGSSRASEIREVQAGYSRPDQGVLEGSPQRSKTIWGWVVVFVLLALLAVLLIGLWVGNSGGGEWGNTMRPNLMFNLHPLFMVLGFILIVGHTNLIYRFWPDANITALRIAHATLQLSGWLLMVLGVYAVGFSKDYSSKKPSHFVSVHSWIGLIVLIVMTLQWLCGFFGLLVPGCHGERRAAYRLTHVFTGNVIFLLGCAEILIGIDQLKPTASTNTLALTVAAYAILGGYLLSTNKFSKGRPDPDAAADRGEREPLTRQSGQAIYT
ncbi:putative Cytochrome b561 [Hypsibius exemplaris]|uniref:Cytochrome b561 n=1 Tax=Hypsibius exemplaris TaxID=2072580 RepID=A0A1W0WKY6_HYPEX|nr:putative Cytochrome b561 [Hypsibius exemplaris]